MSHTSIIAKNITVNQQSNLLLDDVSFALDKGEHLVITGSSGGGKTTLAKVLAHKIFYNGSVEYSGKNEGLDRIML